MQRIPLHLLLMGETKAGKDTFAATWPKPMMVWHMDGHGQDAPYMKGAKEIGELQYYQLGNYTIEYRDIIAVDGGFIRIEYYSSDDPNFPQVAQVLEMRMGAFVKEQAGWQTLVVGSLSSAALEGRYSEMHLNPQFKDPRKWYGAATEYVERLVFWQKCLKINVIFTCHVGRDKDEVGGEFLFTPDLPGRLSYGAGRYFPEMYRLYIQRNPETGEASRVLQTDGDGRFQCGNHIDCDNPCYPHYESLWTKWDLM